MLIATGLALTASALPQTTFADVTSASGLHHVQRAVSRGCLLLQGPSGCEMEFMSGGAAVADINGDGWPDVYLTRIDGPDSMFLNRGDGTFLNVARRVGLGAALQSNGAAFGDIDNDGDPDLFVTVIGESGDQHNARHRLFVNDGRGFFREEGLARGATMLAPGGINGWSVAFGDYDRDGWIDLHVTQWAQEDVSRARLLRNRGASAPGHFEDVTEAAGLAMADVFGFGTALVDLDGDGWQDLAVAGDFGTSRLYWNGGDGTFVNGTAAAGVGTDENGMGSTFGDYDGDGDLDWFVSSFYDPFNTCSSGGCSWQGSGNRLFRNDGGRLFSDATDSAGVREGGWGWGSVFFDYDNDADLDLLSVNGIRFSTPLAAPYFRDATRLWSNDGRGRMVDRALPLGLTDDGSGKGVVTLDYDRDGDLDVLIVQNSEPATLYRNDRVNRGAWLQVDVVGTQSSRDALGAKVRVWAARDGVPQVREVGVCSHFLGQSERRLHFGMGRATRAAKVEVTFPASGRTQTLLDVPLGRSIQIVER